MISRTHATLVPWATTALCLLVALLALLKQGVPLPPWLAAAVHGVTPGAALAFACIGVGHGIDGQRGGWMARAQTLSGCAALMLSLLPQWQLSSPTLRAALGQVSPLMATGLCCASLPLLARQRSQMRVAHAALLGWLPALLLTVIALLGAMSITMGPPTGEFWLASVVVSPAPALAFLLLTVRILHHRSGVPMTELREDFRLSIMSLMVLTAVVVVTGIATFWAVQTRLQESEQERLELSGYRREMAFSYQLASASRLASLLASQPGVMHAMAGWREQPAAAESALNEAIASVWTEDFNGIRFELEKSTARLPSKGHFVVPAWPGIVLKQATQMQFELQWHEGLMAYARVPVMKDKVLLGWVVSQQQLGLMTQQLFDTSDMGPNVEVRMCAAESVDQAWCLPSRADGARSSLPMRRKDGAPSAVALGIRGDQGVVVASDEHGTPVIDVYASVQLPMGLHLRQSIATVMAPVRDKLNQVFVVIGVMLGAGMLIMNLQVRPLALRLVLNEKRLLTVMNSVSDGIITTDNAGHVTYLNRAAEAMTGWALSHADGQCVEEIYPVIDVGSGKPAASIVAQVLDGGVDRRSADVDLLTPDGTRIAVSDNVSLVRDREGLTLGTVLVFRNVSVARARSAAISHEASHDALTGLINRKEFERRLADLATLPKDPIDAPDKHSLLYIDLDKFKQVNDTAGHAAGDELLRQVTRRMHKELRASDIFARVGGDEFVIILPGCALVDATRVADQVRRAVEGFEFSWNGVVFKVGASLGLVCFESGHDDSAGIVAAADAACYRAKSEGRNRVEFQAAMLKRTNTVHAATSKAPLAALRKSASASLA